MQNANVTSVILNPAGPPFFTEGGPEADEAPQGFTYGTDAPPADDPWADIEPEYRQEIDADALADDATYEDARRLANRALWKMRECDREIEAAAADVAERLAWLESERQRCLERIEEMAGPARRRREYVAERNAGTFRTLLHLAGKASVKLLDGTIKRVTTRQENIAVVDEDAVKAYARQAGIEGAIQTTERVMLKPLKAWWKSTGEIPPGCEYVAPETAVQAVTE